MGQETAQSATEIRLGLTPIHAELGQISTQIVTEIGLDYIPNSDHNLTDLLEYK